MWQLSRPASNSTGGIDNDRPIPIDTLKLAQQFEEIGLDRGQSERLTRHISALLIRQQAGYDATYISRVELDKLMLEMGAQDTAFKSELMKSQELHLAGLQKDSDRLQGQLDKIRAEIRYEVDKLTSSQRLDLNLEKGRMRDELQALRDKANGLEVLLDREINALRTSVEQAKNDVLKWVLGILGALLTAALACIRLFYPPK